VTVDTAFPVVDVGFTYEVAVSALTVSSPTGTFVDPLTFDDPGGSFLTTVKVGYTLVIINNGERRQIVRVVSNTRVLLDLPATPLPLCSYRVDNSLATYGGSSGDYLAALDVALTGQLTLYPDQQQYILDFLDQVFTDIFTSATGETTATQPQLDDTNGTFLTSGVTTAHYVYIVSGTNAGFYRITGVNSETQLEVDPVFPATLVGISYRIVKLFGVSAETVDALFSIYQNIAALLADAVVFQALITTPIAVVWSGAPDPDSFARGTLLSDLDARDVIVDARLADIPTEITTVENVLASTDVLYDKRYTWIDARINLKSGLVVQGATAVENRIQAQEDFYNQLIKLLAVEED
jgi:hypothetical protein